MTTSTLEKLERDGFCVVEQLIPRDEVDAVRRSVAASVHEHTSLPMPKGYVTGFLRVNQAMAPYLAHPKIMAVVKAIFGDHARISMLTGSVNAPGIERGWVHADWPYNQKNKSHVQAPYPDIVMNLVTMWMLTDYTLENGGTIVVPGSHLHNRSPGFDDDLDPNGRYEGEVQLQGKAGDVGVFDARTWHAIAPNTSASERVGVIVRYAPWWINLNPLRPGTRDRRLIVEDNDGTDPKVETLPQSIYDRLPDAVKPLVYHVVPSDPDD